MAALPRSALYLLLLVATLCCGNQEQGAVVHDDRVPRSEPLSATAPSELPSPWSPVWSMPESEPLGDASAGAKLVEHFECGRCHESAATKAVLTERHCVRCHQQITEGRFSDKEDHAQWRQNVAHLTQTPTLDHLSERFHYRWLVDFIAEPHDLRANLHQQMPRLDITRQQARDIATHLMGGKTQDPAPEQHEAQRLARLDPTIGATLLEELGCKSCHVLPAASMPTEKHRRETRPAVMLAPDLRHVRQRFRPSRLIQWLKKPHSLKPGTPMPETPMSAAQRDSIAAYLLFGPFSAREPSRVPSALEPLSRPVRYEEVARRVFDVTCRHCHGRPRNDGADSGPGNSGGFGFPAIGLSFSSYEDIASGYLDDKQARHSVFAMHESGKPRLIAALWARHAEQAGKPVKGLRGMPLGLPPLPPEDIRLVASWIAQGRPR